MKVMNTMSVKVTTVWNAADILQMKSDHWIKVTLSFAVFGKVLEPEMESRGKWRPESSSRNTMRTV